MAAACKKKFKNKTHRCAPPHVTTALHTTHTHVGGLWCAAGRCGVSRIIRSLLPVSLALRCRPTLNRYQPGCADRPHRRAPQLSRHLLPLLPDLTKMYESAFERIEVPATLWKHERAMGRHRLVECALRSSTAPRRSRSTRRRRKVAAQCAESAHRHSHGIITGSVLYPCQSRTGASTATCP